MDIIEFINTEIKQSSNPDPVAITNKIYSRVSKSDLKALLKHEVDHRIRIMVQRPTERSGVRGFVAMAESIQGDTKSKVETLLADIAASPSDLRSTLSCRFAVGDGVRISWGEATVEQHRDRILFLSGMRNGIEKTIQLHQEAVDLIERKGVSCLNDILD